MSDEPAPAAPAPMAWHGPRAGLGWADVRELWEYRDLFTALVGRELRVRYRQAVIGAAWAVVQPVAKLAVFAGVLTLFGARPSSGDVPYLVTAYVGLICWQVLAGSLREAAGTLITNREMITKVYFPRVMLAGVPVAVALVDFLVCSVLLGPLLFWAGVTPSLTWLLVPVLVAGLLLVALACALWLSAANALYRDVGYTVPLMLDVGVFASPVYYETAFVRDRAPDWVVWLFSLNPMVGVLESLRWALWGAPLPPAGAMLLSATVAVAVLVGGFVFFHRVDTTLADRV